MKSRLYGVVLAGGHGTRLSPLTKLENKHLLPVSKQRMIELPLFSLQQIGVTDLIVVIGGNNKGSFIDLIGSGKYQFNSVAYTCQEGAGGLPAAIKCAESFIPPYPEHFVAILGDNYFEEDLSSHYHKWVNKGNHHIILAKTQNPFAFGVAEINGQQILSLEEKPINPKSDWAVTGCYFFNQSVWTQIDSLKPSERGELEILDLFQEELPYIGYSCLDENLLWSDMGTFETWMKVSQHLHEKGR